MSPIAQAADRATQAWPDDEAPICWVCGVIRRRGRVHHCRPCEASQCIQPGEAPICWVCGAPMLTGPIPHRWTRITTSEPLGGPDLSRFAYDWDDDDWAILAAWRVLTGEEQ